MKKEVMIQNSNLITPGLQLQLLALSQHLKLAQVADVLGEQQAMGRTGVSETD